MRRKRIDPSRKARAAIHAALEATSKYKKALTEAELAAVTAGLKDEMVYERDGIFAYLYCEKCGM